MERGFIEQATDPEEMETLFTAEDPVGLYRI